MFETRRCIGMDGNVMEYTRLTKKAFRRLMVAILLFVLLCVLSPKDEYGDSSWRDAHPERTRINQEYDRALRDFGK